MGGMIMNLLSFFTTNQLSLFLPLGTLIVMFFASFYPPKSSQEGPLSPKYKKRRRLFTIIFSILVVIFSINIIALRNESSIEQKEEIVEDVTSLTNRTELGETDSFCIHIADFEEMLKESAATDFEFGYSLEGTTKTVLGTDSSMIPLTSYETNTNHSVISKYIGKSSVVVIPTIVDNCIVSTIGDNAFDASDNYISSPIWFVKICEGISSIKDNAFKGNVSLEYVVLPSSISFISQSAFDDCPNVTLFVKENSYSYNYCIEHNFSYGLY